MRINYKKEEAIKLIEDFLKVYEKPLKDRIYTSDIDFDEFTYQSSLYDMIKGDIDTAFDKPNGEYIYELCSLLGIYDPEDDTYEKIVDQIEEIYGPLDGKTIVEVTSGAFAPISAKIAERTKGNADVYAIGPYLIIDEKFGIRPIRDSLINENQIPDGAIIVSKEPCASTFTLGHMAVVKNVQLYTMLCSCNDYQMRDYIPSGVGMNKKALEHYRPHYIIKDFSRKNQEELTTNEANQTLWKPIFRIYLEDRLPKQEVHQTELYDSLYDVDKIVVYTKKRI